MGQLPTWLKVEHWYHVFVLLGAAGAIAALTLDIKGVENAHALLVCIGLFFVGIGEWINHPLQTRLIPPSYQTGGLAGVTEAHPRNPQLVGSLFDVLGFVLLIAGFYKIIAAA